MTIPNTARTGLISGFPGNISHDGPIRAQSFVLDATTEANSVFGRAFTVKSATAETVQPGGTGKFAGIMINPKAYAIDTEYAGNGTVAEFLQMGEVYVAIEVANSVAPAVGGKVYFDPATGKLKTDADTAANTEIKGAVIARHAPATLADGSQLAVISLTGPAV